MTMPTEEQLLARVINNKAQPTRKRLENKHRKDTPLWNEVSDLFALGAVYSKELCIRFKFNPETGKPL